MLAIVDGSLALIGALIGLSIGYIALVGYKETGSPALLRLSSAFVCLFLGFTLEALAVFSYVGLLPIFALAAFFIVASSFLQTLGFFFLAFSHMLNVRAFQRALITPLLLPLSISVIQVSAAFKSISFYLLIYGSLETAIAYIRTRRAETLVLAVGFVSLALSEFVRWLSYIELSWPFWYSTSLILRVIGLATLFIPIIKFARSREVVVQNGL